MKIGSTAFITVENHADHDIVYHKDIKAKYIVSSSGKSSAEQTVRDFLQEHPDAKKVEVIRGTGLSKPTVYKRI